MSDQHFEFRVVPIRPTECVENARKFLGEDYWLFLGICIVGMLIGSAGPMGILLGPMFVGIYLCYLEKERSGTSEFGTLFRGFDQFIDSLFATLIMLALVFVVTLPLVIIMLGFVMFPIIAAEQAGREPGPEVMIGVLTMYPIMILGSLLCYVPFMFTYQLIAEHRLTAWPAVKLSAKAVWANMYGVTWFLFVLMLLSFILTLMCYVPAMLFLPISFGAVFTLYRDVFPEDVVEAEIQ